MTARNELGDFLTAHRGRVTPDQVGLPAGGTRRVPGLRREEVATLAGISVEYYTRLERGNPGQVSEEILDSVSQALLLGADERDHLVRLVRAAAPQGLGARKRAARRSHAPQSVRQPVQRMIDLLPTPAYVRNSRFDILAANALGRALYQPVFDSVTSLEGFPNTARFTFLDPQAAEFFVDYESICNGVVAALHTEAARSPYDKELSDLIGQLSTRSEAFRVLWAQQNVGPHRAGTKVLRHPVVGELTLDYEALEIAADEGLRLNIYTAPPDSTSAENLALLASWTSDTTINN